MAEKKTKEGMILVNDSKKKNKINKRKLKRTEQKERKRRRDFFHRCFLIKITKADTVVFGQAESKDEVLFIFIV